MFWAFFVALIFILLLSRHLFVTTDRKKQSADNDPQVSDSKPKLSKFNLVDSKTESTGESSNVMDLYVPTEPNNEIDLTALNDLCRERKEQFSSGNFYILVVFDNKDNAAFPSTPLTAAYGADEKSLRHIKAMYTYNRLNGYSTLDTFDNSAWDSVAKSIKI